jgi:hypothetical protein
MSGPLDEPTVVDWLGLHIALPRPWEVVRHGTSALKGSLVFADRTRQRLQVTWTACKKAPDVDRLLSDHKSRQLERHAEARFEKPPLIGGWRGLVRRFEDSRAVSRLARYEPSVQRLMEIVLEHYPDEPAEAELLEQIVEGLEVAGDPQRYRIFGLDVTVPEGWYLGSTRTLPADVTLTFQDVDPATHQEPKAKVDARRMGLAEGWFDGKLERFIERDQIKSDVTFSPLRMHGHPGTIAECDVPGPRIKRLANRHLRRVEHAWHCDKNQAICRLIAVAPASRELTPEGFELRCHAL